MLPQYLENMETHISNVTHIKLKTGNKTNISRTTVNTKNCKYEKITLDLLQNHKSINVKKIYNSSSF